MVDTRLFQTHRGALLPTATARDAEHAPAYAYGPRHQLTQPAATGCPGDTFYAHAEEQLDQVLALAASVDAALLRKNPQAKVLPFELGVVKLQLNAGDTERSGTTSSMSAASPTRCSTR